MYAIAGLVQPNAVFRLITSLNLVTPSIGKSAPDILGLDESGQSKVIDPDSTDNAAIMKAAHACPMSAIIVEDMETYEKLWPKD